MCPNIKANGSYEEIKDTLVSIHMGHGTKLMSLGGAVGIFLGGW